MALLTEEDVRRMSNGGTRGPVVVRREEVLTPGAKDYLSAHKVEVVYPEGKSEGHGAGTSPRPAKAGGEKPAARYRTLFGADLYEKPEHMTHLKGNILVFKDHPPHRIPGVHRPAGGGDYPGPARGRGRGLWDAGRRAGGGAGLRAALYPLRCAG